ncbi:hypothetical protein ACFSMW_20460 [Virgibacillus halophilus]|uniref:Fur-regulated basic protein B n=1 Tax=Tigheibacillus halophilus TaxID=361280 RepID=A0ABU5CBT7_9BACI|nr:hypothetical protein [Virgibacillus halophilus]MDY0396768.1 hypothetical protein [Virgibacillus halophilus]
MANEKWKILRDFIENELIEAQENYESILEKQLEIILEYMDELDK